MSFFFKQKKHETKPRELETSADFILLYVMLMSNASKSLGRRACFVMSKRIGFS